MDNPENKTLTSIDEELRYFLTQIKEKPALSPQQSQLLQQFSDFLLTPDIEPLAERQAIDLRSLFLEMAELKNEVKQQSRQFKKNLDDYKELLGLLKFNHELLQQQFQQQQELVTQNAMKEKKAHALELIGFCDYLHFSLDNIENLTPKTWSLRYFQSPKLLSQIVEGQRLLIKRFHLILKGMDVRPIPVVGEHFNPETMHATETCHFIEQPNALVISELQTGYFMGQDILRLASVVVNKH